MSAEPKHHPPIPKSFEEAFAAAKLEVTEHAKALADKAIEEIFADRLLKKAATPLSSLAPAEYLRNVSDDALVTVLILAVPLPTSTGKVRAALSSEVVRGSREELLRRLEQRKTALEGILQFYKGEGENALDAWERVATLFYQATGFLRPGKAEPLELSAQADRERRREAAWIEWQGSFLKAAREALK
jgi:hypothetical protein